MTEEKILAVRVALTGITDETRQIAELNDEIQKLAQRRRDLNKAIDDNGKATEAETNEMLANEQATRDLNEKKAQLTRTEKLAAKEFTVASGSMNELRAKTSALRNEANNLNLTTDAGKRKFKELNQQILANTNQIRNYDRGISGSSTLVGEYGRGIMNAFSKIGIAVAGAWAIIKAGEKVINSAQGAGDKWKESVSGLKSGLDDMFKSLATGDFSGFLTGIKDAIEAGREYAEVLDDLGDRLRQYAINEVDTRGEILKKKKEMYDFDKTDDERRAIAMEVDTMEKKLSVDKVKNMEIAYNAEKTLIAGHARMKEDELEYYVKNYESLESLLALGEKYNDIIKKRQIALISGSGATAEYIESLEKQKNEMGEIGKEAGRYVTNISRLNDTELDSFVQKYIAMGEAKNQYDENTMRVDKYINKLEEDIKKEKEKNIKDLSEAQKKEIGRAHV